MVLENNIYKEEKMKLKLLDLFSGIGGFSLGLESTGQFETIAFVEKDEFCQKVLKKNFNNIPIESEVRNVKGDRYAADIVCGGFPCQPFSVAGKRKGTSDDRYLWPEMLRVIREAKPRWVIGENVRGIINIEDGMVFKQVHSDLEAEGFQTKCFVLPAASVNAPHQRYRTFFIGQSMENSRRSLQSRGIKQGENADEDGQRDAHQFKRSGGTRENALANSNNGHIRQEEEVRTRGNTSEPSSEDVSDTNEQMLEGQWQEPQRSQEEFTDISESGWWELEPDVGRVAHGISNRAHRLRSLGNAVVPQIIYQLGKAIGVAEGLDKH